MSDETEFPVEALGSILKEAVEALSEGCDVPLEASGLMVLGTASVATQSFADVFMKGRRFPTSLNALWLADSGEGKSRITTPLWQRLWEFCARREEEYRQPMAEYQFAKKKWDNLLRKRAGEGEGATLPGSEPEPPPNPFFITQNFTLSGLFAPLSTCECSGAILSDEGGMFFDGQSMKVENLGETITNLSKIWDGAPISIYRKGEGKVVIRDKRLTTVLACQDSMASLLKDAKVIGQGYWSRFLLVATPPVLFEEKRFYEHLLNANLSLSSLYIRGEILLRRAYEGPFCTTKPVLKVLVSEAAFNVLKEYWIGIAQELDRLPKNCPYAAFGRKIDSHALRIAGNLICWNCREEELAATELIVDGSVMGRALRLVDYFWHQWKAFYHEERHDGLPDKADDLSKRLRDVVKRRVTQPMAWRHKGRDEHLKHPHTYFRISRIKHSVRKSFRPHEVDQMLALLEHWGHVRVLSNDLIGFCVYIGPEAPDTCIHKESGVRGYRAQNRDAPF